MYRYNNLRFEIPPAVFHPGYFFSTQFLLKYIEQMPIADKSLLELGCGSGLIAAVAKQQGRKLPLQILIALPYIR
jgi:release factor glutamine methyltransferase